MSKKTSKSGRFSIFDKKPLTDAEIARKVEELAKKRDELPDFPGEINPAKASIGRIRLTSRTKLHASSLRTLGYEVEESGGYVIIQCNGFVNECEVGDLAKIAEDKKLLHYKTRVTFPDGSKKYSVPLCNIIGKWSCLVADPFND